MSGAIWLINCRIAQSVLWCVLNDASDDARKLHYELTGVSNYNDLGLLYCWVDSKNGTNDESA